MLAPPPTIEAAVSDCVLCSKQSKSGRRRQQERLTARGAHCQADPVYTYVQILGGSTSCRQSWRRCHRQQWCDHTALPRYQAAPACPSPPLQAGVLGACLLSSFGLRLDCACLFGSLALYEVIHCTTPGNRVPLVLVRSDFSRSATQSCGAAPLGFVRACEVQRNRHVRQRVGAARCVRVWVRGTAMALTIPQARGK